MLRESPLNTSVQSFDGDVSDGIALLREEIANERVGGGTATPNRPVEVVRASRERSVLCANVPNHTDAAIPTGTTLRVIAEAVTTLRADALACAIAHSSGQSVEIIVEEFAFCVAAGDNAN